MIDPTDILQRHKRAESMRLNMCSIWRDVAAHADPIRRDVGLDGADDFAPSISGGALIFDSTLREAARTYAAGCMSWLTPSETTWFALSAPFGLREDDAAKSWYSRCTDITREILADSNFYSAIHDLYHNDGIFGTSGLVVSEDSTRGIRFESLQVGDYAILENHLGEVDTLFRIRRYSPRQAAQEFGPENLPEETRKALSDPKKADAVVGDYLHFIGPRESRDRFKANIQNAPVASVWIELKSRKVVRESGFSESPFAVHRHLRFSRCPYGRSPGMEAIFDARQLNYMQQLLDTTVEKHVRPPVIVPSNYKGVVDLRGGGISYEQNSGDIRHLNNPGNYLVGEDRTEFRKRQINNAFHVELFQALASVPVGKEMTAEEVRQRRNDRLPNFSPTYARKVNEISTPVMRIVFSILLRRGAFPPPPLNIQQEVENGIFIPDPQIVYSSRMALALQAIHNDAFLDALNLGGQIATMRPEVLDNIDIDEGFRNYARNAGITESSLVPEQERDQLRRERAEAQARAEAEAMQLEEADAVGKLAGAMK